MTDYWKESREKEHALLKRLKENESVVRDLQQEAEKWHAAPDSLYRYYHQSYKVFDLNGLTKQIVELLATLGDVNVDDLHPFFLSIYQEAIVLEFTPRANDDWLASTRPVLEAYFHAKHLLDMMVQYGLDSDERKREGTGGWFTVLYLYGIR